MKLKKKTSRMSTVGLSSFFALLAVLGVAVTCPMMSMSASAADDSAMLAIDFYLANNSASVSQMSQMLTIDFFLANGNPNYPAISKMLGIDFYLRGNMSIDMEGLAPEVTGEVQPLSADTQFVSKSTGFSVYSSDTKGFVVSAGSTDGKTTAMELKDGETVLDTIPTLGSNAMNSTDFGTKAWGYKITEAGSANSKAYQPLTAGLSEAYAHNTNGDVSLELTFGAKVDMSAQAGEYTRGVKISAVANAENTAAVAESKAVMDKFIAKTFELRPELKEQVDARKEESGKGGDIETMTELVNILNAEQYAQGQTE